ncbi:divalent-cation tolerance protein CutA [Shewanella yunxiaonensis]|uniref:Divalent-cation tolerance protein CutA n=2 Tax=Shewanellaceae TaxID=267890 RepID=A0ABX7YXV7_9GAMM|nr:divalent-cation tolerance protein CutA [Shewanella yunxiaonensis]
MPEFLLVFCSCPDHDTALTLARTLVKEGLVACAQLSSPITSVYHWQEQLCEDSEISLQLKCLAAVYPKLQQRVLQLHPYEVPELIAVEIQQGLPTYLDWIKDNTRL